MALGPGRDRRFCPRRGVASDQFKFDGEGRLAGRGRRTDVGLGLGYASPDRCGAAVVGRLHFDLQFNCPVAAGAKKNGMLAGLAARQHGSRGCLLGERFAVDERALPNLLVDVALGLARVAPRMQGRRMKRIALFGPESTGKTQLAQHLGAHFNAPVVAEYAREFWDQHGGITLAHIPMIAREQWRREDAAVALAPPLVLCDTEALTTVLWSDLLYGTCPADIRAEAERRASNYTLYLLLDVDVPFTPDPQRAFADLADRARCFNLWREALERRQLPYQLIRGAGSARQQQAIAAVNQLGF